MTDDLVKWLREQIAEAEAVARRADPGPWVIRQLGRHDGAVVLTDVGLRTHATKLPTGGKCVADTSGRVEAVVNANHIALHDPAAVLAQCEAHTAILAEHRRYDEWEREYNARTPGLHGRTVHPDPSCVGCGTGFDEEPRTKHVNECPTLRALALAYQHRPGYLEAWRP